MKKTLTYEVCVNYLYNKIYNTIWHNKIGEYHREDGPAIERADGRKEWYLNDLLHREDGPAIENADGRKFWYLEGKEYTEAKFLKKIADNKLTTCEGKVLEIDGKKYKLVSI
jgi:hypothetical protein